MKATYLLRNRSRFSFVKKILILVAVFVVGAIIFNLLQSSLVAVVSPLWRAENVVSRSLGNFGGYFSSKGTLVRENKELKDKVTQLEARTTLLERFAIERDSLLNLLGRKSNTNAVASSVLVHPPQTPYDIVMVDAGSSLGIGLGYNVYLPEGPLIGTVTEIMSHQA